MSAAAVEKTPLELAQERSAKFYETHEDELNPSLKSHKKIIEQRAAAKRREEAAAEAKRIQENINNTKCSECGQSYKHASEQRKGGKWADQEKKVGPWKCGPCNLGYSWDPNC